MEYGIVFYALIFVTAILYSSVGHGGASGYLAIMAIFAVSPENMRASALILNLFVAGISFYSYYRGGFFRLKLLLPFIVLSVPMSFLGARLQINPSTYKIILGIFLLIAITRMLFAARKPVDTKPINIPLALAIGAFLGFFSGLIGIGGGIILSPILLLLRWATIKETAAVSAIFIFLNSASGIAGLVSRGGMNPVAEIYILIALGIGGSLIGSHMGRARLTSLKLTYLLAAVLLFASFKLFYF
ncbi:sulfite exporter TauE/SafE family protein [Mariniphaga sediminis]|uniref:sulfite exporter TauE/SafE family protein n=1 Tax=Mariniphaga sediminis TaxID=1628158 RepID=UPI003569529F